MFTALVAPATAAPDWWKGQKSSSEHSRALTTGVTESGIHHLAAQAKIASISEELQNVLILMSVCFLSWRIGVKREQKEAVSCLQKDFPACGPSSTPICNFKRSAGRILSTPALSGRNILVLSALKF